MITQMQLYYLIALLYVPNLSINHGVKLLQAFPDLRDFFNSSDRDLLQLGLSDESIAKMRQIKQQQVEKNLQWATNSNNHIVTLHDAVFPKLLREIQNPPLVLFVQGNLAALNQPQIAMVGSRNPSPAGKDIAFNLAKELTNLGLTITSGFATGIDAASHLGALAASGYTIAVMGTGLDQIYPPGHTTLARKILQQNGALISEFPLNMSAKKYHFPLRNRIISGLSLGTLVVEAALRSGSLITARLAAEQGREVFAVPGSILNPLSHGCHSIIQQGAKLVENPSDIIEELGPLAATLRPLGADSKDSGIKNILDRNNKLLLECVGFEVTPMDCLIARSKLNITEISTILIALELLGLIKTVPGGYVRVRG